MKKIVFEGTVNGQKFDNIQDYNAAVASAIALGEALNTQASTKTIDTDDEIEAPETKNVNDPTMYPGFPEAATNADLSDKFILDGIKESELADLADNYFLYTLVPALKRFSVADLIKYRDRAEAILKHVALHKDRLNEENDNIEAELNTLKSNLHELQTKYAEVQKQSKLCLKQSYVVGVTENLYKQVYDEVNNRITRETMHAGTANAIGRVDTPQGASEYAAGIRRLVDAIFG